MQGTPRRHFLHVFGYLPKAARAATRRNADEETTGEDLRGMTAARHPAEACSSSSRWCSRSGRIDSVRIFSFNPSLVARTLEIIARA